MLDVHLNSKISVKKKGKRNKNSSKHLSLKSKNLNIVFISYIVTFIKTVFGR
jgi:hypothetical protein